MSRKPDFVFTFTRVVYQVVEEYNMD